MTNKYKVFDSINIYDFLLIKLPSFWIKLKTKINTIWNVIVDKLYGIFEFECKIISGFKQLNKTLNISKGYSKDSYVYSFLTSLHFGTFYLDSNYQLLIYLVQFP